MSYPQITPKVFQINQYLEWNKYLDQNGYVVIGNILSNSEREIFWKSFKSDFNVVSPNFNFDDKLTWSIKTYPGMFGKGICPYNGLGQSNFSWQIRTHPNIKEIYFCFIWL